MTKFRFYFPDNKDFVDPKFDGRDNSRTKHHRPYDDDCYPHEILKEQPYDGMLVSLAGVGTMQKRGKYYEPELTEDFYFLGAREFLRINKAKTPGEYKLMGDCGAFDYHAEYEPPFTVDELIEFYDRGGFDYGISLDHIVFPYARDEVAKAKLGKKVIDESERRIAITLKNAKEFFEKSKHYDFEPYGVAHGYDKTSFISSVRALQEIGYRKITIGGMIKSKTDELLELLEVLGEERHPDTEFHLLGICRFDNIPTYVKAGVTSADSTSPLMQGLKGGKYYTISDDEIKFQESLMIRVRQCDHDNVQKHIDAYRDELRQLIDNMQKQSEFDIDLSNTALSINECVKRLEVDCLKKLESYDKTGFDLHSTLKALMAYEKVTNDVCIPTTIKSEIDLLIKSNDDINVEYFYQAKKIFAGKDYTSDGLISSTGHEITTIVDNSLKEFAQVNETIFSAENELKAIVACKAYDLLVKHIDDTEEQSKSSYEIKNELIAFFERKLSASENHSTILLESDFMEIMNNLLKSMNKKNAEKEKKFAVIQKKYNEFLSQRAWRLCICGICNNKGGLMNIVFRSNQSNRRRGIHNLAIVTEHKQRVIETIQSQAES